MLRVLCVALQSITGQWTYLTFGPRTTINDVMIVIDEECHEQLTRLRGMSLLSAPDEDGLRNAISAWKNHFDA